MASNQYFKDPFSLSNNPEAVLANGNYKTVEAYNLRHTQT